MAADANRNPNPPSRAAAGSASLIPTPKGVCIVCGSGLLIQFWRGHPENQRIHCNGCGTEVTPYVHDTKQPNNKLSGGENATDPKS